MLAEQLSGWDFLIAGLIVVFVEFVVKKIFKDGDKFYVVWKLTPIVLGVAAYIILAVTQKTEILTGLVHGLGVGLAAMGSYDLILKAMKEAGTKSIEETNEAVKKAIEGKE